jgi:hypothetical protein
MARLAGTVHLKINGTNYTTDVEEGFQIKIQDIKREPKMGSDGILHYIENRVASTFSGNILTTPNLNPDALTNAQNVTAQLQLANGDTAVFRNAMFTGEPTIDTKNGTMAIEFTGLGRWV